MNAGDILKKFPTRDGKEVVLQIVTAADLSALFDYINQLVKEDTYIYTDQEITMEQEKEWLDRTLKAVEEGNRYCYLAKCEGKVIGIGEVNRGWMREQEQGTLRFSIAQGFRDQGIGTEIINTAMEIAQEMNLRIIKAWIFADDEKATYLAKKMGFIEVGKLPESIRYKNSFVDQILVYKKLENTYNPVYGSNATSEESTEVEIKPSDEDII